MLLQLLLFPGMEKWMLNNSSFHKILIIDFLGVCLFTPSTGQLLGHFKVANFPEGFHYRDRDTVTASKQAALFGTKFQAQADARSQRLRYINNKKYSKVPEYESNFKIGKEIADSKMFDVLDSKYLEPYTETRSNKPHEEVLEEYSTSSIRLLPGEGLPPTPAPPTRAPHRLLDLNTRRKESERAKNGRLGTIFDNNQQNTFSITYAQSGINKSLLPLKYVNYPFPI